MILRTFQLLYNVFKPKIGLKTFVFTLSLLRITIKLDTSEQMLGHYNLRNRKD